MTSCMVGLEDPPDLTDDFRAVNQIAAVPAMLEILCHITGLGFAAVARVTEDRWILCRVRDEIGLGLRPGDALQAETMPCGKVGRTRRPILIEDVTKTSDRQHPAPHGYGLRSYVSAPILLPDGTFFGTLCAIGLSPAKLDPPDIVETLRQFTELIGLQIAAGKGPPAHETQRRRNAETADPTHRRLALLSLLTEHLPVGVGLLDADGRVIVANPALQRFLPQGDTPSIGDRARARWTGYDADTAVPSSQADPFTRLLRGETLRGARFLHRGEDGTACWTRVSGRSVDVASDRKGERTVAVHVVIEDEQALSRAEVALRQSEARLQAAIELVGLSTYSWDPTTGALGWDARLKAMWGLEPDAPVDQAIWLSAIHPEDRPRVEEAIARCCDPAGDGVYHIEYRVIGIGDGVERWVSTHGRTEFIVGRPVGFVGVALDITERKRREAAFRENEKQFRLFADHSANVLWLVDLETRRLHYLSPAFRHIWGKPPDGQLGIDEWLETLHPEDRASAVDTLDRVAGGEVVVLEYRIVRTSDGTVRRIRDTFFPIRSEDGRILRIGGIAEDVTGRTGARIYVVDEDAGSRRTLVALLQPAGYTVQVFESAAALAEVAPSLRPGCVVLDIETAGAESLTVARTLKAGRLNLPVLVTGRSHGDVGFGVRAMKAGAVDYLEKPWQPIELLTAVSAALAELRTDTERSRAREDAHARISALSAREREVLEGLLAGGTNKTIGRALGLSPRTVEIHRAHAMETLGVRTLPEAVLMAAEAGVRPTYIL